MAAAALLGVAVVLWLLAITTSWWTPCPESSGEPVGLDKGISAWPPGADCYDRRLVEGGSVEIVNYQAIPWLKWVILGLGITAWATLLVGLFASIATLRSRPVKS